MDYLEIVRNPYLFATSSIALDTITTGVYVSLYGYRKEWNRRTRELMKQHGVWKGLAIQTLKGGVGVILGGGILFFLVDNALGIENEPYNIHKIWLYGWGGLSGLAGVGNFLALILRPILPEKMYNVLFPDYPE